MDENDALEATLFGGSQPPVPQLPAEGLKRYFQLGVRGATLGFGGTQIPPEGLGESLAELGGSIPTIAATSAAVSPLVAATGRILGPIGAALRVPTVARVTSAAATGSIVGGAQALSEGKSVPEGMAKSAAEYAALEGVFLGGARILRKSLKVPPAGKELIPSPMENVAKDELLRGQGLPPETPPNLNLPVVRSTGVFDAKDFVGSGTVLNPERNPQLRQGRIISASEQTRTMLPEGQTQRALPEGTGEISRVAAPETEFPWEPYRASIFTEVDDPRIGEKVLIPKTPEVEEAVLVSQGVNPRATELPLTEAQVHSLETVQKAEKVKLDTVSKREPALTSNLVKQPEEVVETVTDTPGAAPLIEAHSIELTPAGQEARALLIKSGLSEDEYVKFGSSLRGTRDQKLSQLLGWLKEKCR